jgi:hypothetical protein
MGGDNSGVMNLKRDDVFLVWKNENATVLSVAHNTSTSTVSKFCSRVL